MTQERAEAKPDSGRCLRRDGHYFSGEDHLQTNDSPGQDAQESAETFGGIGPK